MGIFPMAEARDDPEIHWVDPRTRGILPLDGFHISRSLARRLRDPALHGDCGSGLRSSRHRFVQNVKKPG